MLSCKETSLLVSQALDRKLTWSERVGVRLHLWICAQCRRYERQLRWLNGLRGRLDQVPEELSEEAHPITYAYMIYELLACLVRLKGVGDPHRAVAADHYLAAGREAPDRLAHLEDLIHVMREEGYADVLISLSDFGCEDLSCWILKKGGRRRYVLGDQLGSNTVLVTA